MKLLGASCVYLYPIMQHFILLRLRPFGQTVALLLSMVLIIDIEFCISACFKKGHLDSVDGFHLRIDHL